MIFSLENAYIIEVNLSDEHNNILLDFVIGRLFIQQSQFRSNIQDIWSE